MRRIIRVFPRKTNATPDDDLAVVGRGPGLFDEADEVHVSATFTWDLPKVEALAKAWRSVAPVKIGGPATGERGGDFIPGMYLKRGYVITSRGCPNKCWFCSVWRREGGIRELPITEGWNVLDDNLFACSREHIEAVFAMLAKQKQAGQEIQFTGGLEAARLEPWHIKVLRALNPRRLFFAYDTADDLEPLWRAGKMMLDAGFTVASHRLRAYVLCGYRGDTFDAAERRMRQTMEAGFMPFAMLYRGQDGVRDPEWAKWQCAWARPAIIASKELSREGRKTS